MRREEIPPARLVLKDLGIHIGMDWQSVRGRLFSQDRHTDLALHRSTRPLPWDLVTEADI
jgi:hypothetical protein